MGGPCAPAALALGPPAAEAPLGVARVAQRLDHGDQLGLPEAGQAQQLQIQIERRRAGERPQARRQALDHIDAHARAGERLVAGRLGRLLRGGGSGGEGRARQRAHGRHPVLDAPQPGAQGDRGRLQHRGQIDVPDPEPHAEPRETRAVGLAQVLEQRLRGAGAHVAQALDQQEGEPAAGRLQLGRLQPPQRHGQLGQVAIQPLPEPLADGAARLAVQTVGEEQLEARRERRRTGPELADRGLDAALGPPQDAALIVESQGVVAGGEQRLCPAAQLGRRPPAWRRRSAPAARRRHRSARWYGTDPRSARPSGLPPRWRRHRRSAPAGHPRAAP